MKQENRRLKKQEDKRLKALEVALNLIFGLVVMSWIGSICSPMARGQGYPDSSWIITPAGEAWFGVIQPGIDDLIANIGEDAPSFVFPPRPGTVVRYSGAVSGVVYESSKCGGCHLSKDVWKDAPKLSGNHAHHPIGHTWAKTSCTVAGCHQPDENGLPHIGAVKRFKLDGFNADGSPAPFDKQIFGCISCHGSHTTYIEGNPSFLRHASFKDDDTAFCEYCHDYPGFGKAGSHPKNKAILQANGGKHYKTKSDATNHVTRTFKATNSRPETVTKCGGCMFCHFIHQNEKDDPRVIPTVSPSRADIKALMRVPPKALDWGPQGAPDQGTITLRADPLDRYEALCYGCHGNPSIVGSYERNGSLLSPDLHSHRFACAVTGKNTNENIGRTETFPLADGFPGAGGGAMDDYGTVEGQIYCGTCHDVHGNNKPPYLYQLGPNDYASPYISDPVDSVFSFQADRDGFCEQCHCTVSSYDPMSAGASHPVGADKVPVVPHTGAEFPKQFAGGGSGSPLGITAGSNTTKDGVLCLTCHNVHAAATAWDGAVTGELRPAVDSTTVETTGKHGRLLVMDNYSSATGSDLCAACHVQNGGGTIEVSTNNPEAIFTLSGVMNTYTGKGTSWVIEQAPVGPYSITFSPIPDYHNPIDLPSKRLTDGATISFEGIYTAQCDGDVNEDGELTTKDALIVFECFLDRGPCPDCVDINNSGDVTPADALCIFQVYLGMPSCLK